MRLKFGPVRDAVLLIGGLGLLANEALIVAEPRALIITIAAAMIGLPATLFADRKFVGSSSQIPTDPPAVTPPGPPPEQDRATPR